MLYGIMKMSFNNEEKEPVVLVEKENVMVTLSVNRLKYKERKHHLTMKKLNYYFLD